MASNIVNYKETKSETTESPCITKNENDNLEDKIVTASKDAQNFMAIDESTGLFGDYVKLLNFSVYNKYLVHIFSFF